ncbi:MAG: ABC transporter permease [Candidatus Rokuibacteriota bacterium]
MLVWTASVAASLTLGGLLLLVAGVPPLTAYLDMFGEAFGTAYGLSETLVRATPLILAGLGVMLAFKLLFWNIGAEGQLYLGACAATVAAALPLPLDTPWLRLPAMVVAALAAGAAWALIPAALKLTRDVNEILTSLLLNYVAIAFVRYLVYGPWRDPASANFPLTPLFPESAQLARLGDLRINAGFLLALVVLALVHVVQERSRFGFAIRVIGDNPRAARYAGIHVAGTTLVVVAMSGALAGLAGMVEVAGIQHRLIPGLSPGYGYTAIIVALLGQLHPIGILASGVLLGGLFVGGEILQITRQIPLSVVFMFQGLLLLTVTAGEFFARYRLVLRRIPAVERGGEGAS